jgi:hypothetical protein
MKAAKQCKAYRNALDTLAYKGLAASIFEELKVKFWNFQEVALVFLQFAPSTQLKKCA